MTISSDPHFWRRPIYLRLRNDPPFSLFSPAHQFELLRLAVEREHPSEAAKMKDYNTATRTALLDHLASMIESKTEVQIERELWRVRKGKRELRCVTHPLPTGIDLQLLDQDGFRRTQLCRDAPGVQALAEEWLNALTVAGWSRLEI